MQIETQSYQLPQYESAILKKERESKHLSPKVTHVYPEIKEVEKIKIKRHHLDDTEVKQALSYDYEDNPSPRQYLFKGNKLEYDKTDNLKLKKESYPSPRNNNFGIKTNDKNISSEYFDRQPNLNQFEKPQRDYGNDTDNSRKCTEKKFEHQENSTRLKKSISTSDFESLRKEQQQMENKVLGKLTQLENKNDRINQYLIEHQEKSAHQKSQTERHNSENKILSVNQELNKLKDKLKRERTKEKERLHNELKKIKEEGRKLQEQERQRKKSFKELVQNSNHMPTKMLESVENENMIKEKFHEIEKKLLPKTNIVNKRIQCEIYDPRSDLLKRFQEKPAFRCDLESDTDSEFSDF